MDFQGSFFKDQQEYKRRFQRFFFGTNKSINKSTNLDFEGNFLKDLGFF